MTRVAVAMLLALASAAASAQDGGPPRRTIPPSLLVEVTAIQDRFELALATDCDPKLCFSKGCSYVAHTVADRPPSSSLPGLGQGPGPSPVEAQAWLTQARCEFAYEGSLPAANVQALARRLGTKVSGGYTTVSVGTQALPTLPASVQGIPPAAPPEPEPVPEPPPPPDPVRELWTALLPHLNWMIGLVLGTVCGTTLIWAWRRVGRESLEEKAFLADLARDGGDETDAEEAPPEPPPTDETLAAQLASWRLRLQGMDPQKIDPELQAMLRDLLKAGELPLLAKAVLTFPSLPGAFPSGGDIASSKLALAEYLKTVDPAALPSDAELFRALNRHMSSATLASQRDAEVVRSLREEFGSAGLVGLIEGVPARAGALLFALAPAETQQELVHLLSGRQMGAMAEQLLRSNRMDPSETEYLFAILRSAGGPEASAPPPMPVDVSDRGHAFDAAAALSALIPRLPAAKRAELFARALQRFGGSLPAWYAEILVPEMLFSLSDESRADLLLGSEAEPLAAWLSLLDSQLSERVLDGAPASLRSSLRAASGFATRARQVALADRGRRELARGFQAELARSRIRFEQVVRTLAEAP
jgi:hypothetical protein